jgi:hypothetical protein
MEERSGEERRGESSEGRCSALVTCTAVSDTEWRRGEERRV